MKLRIKTIHHHGRTDKMTSQTEWHVTGDIDGDPVAFRYLDCGNNAEYEQESDLTMTAGDRKKYERQLLNWIEKDESVLVDLIPGDSVNLRSGLPPGPGPRRNPGGKRP